MDVAEYQDILLRVPLFAELGADDLARLIPVLGERQLDEGQTLYKEGEAGDSLCIVMSGRLEVVIHKSPEESVWVQTLSPGDVVGEMSCLDPAPRSATVRATMKTELLVLNRSLIEALQKTMPFISVGIVSGISSIVSRRIRDTNDTVVAAVKALSSGQRSVAKEKVNEARKLGAPNLTQSKYRNVQPHYPLDDTDLELLGTVGQMVTCPHGEYLCREGEKGDKAFFLLKGELSVLRVISGKERLLATIPLGGIVGQLSLLDSRVRSASLRAKGEVQAVSLDRDTFRQLLRKQNGFALRFQEHVAVTGIRQMRCATTLLHDLESILARAEELGEAAGTNARYALQAGYVGAAMQEWGLSIEDLDSITVKTPDGIMTPAELKARQGRS